MKHNSLLSNLTTIFSHAIFLILFFFPHFVFPFDHLFKFSQISIREGLSQSSVISMHQDKYGFIWMGTRDGLNKYNGYEFEVFRHEVDNSFSLAGNIINGISEDSVGNIWIAHENGLSKYERSLGRFSNY